VKRLFIFLTFLALCPPLLSQEEAPVVIGATTKKNIIKTSMIFPFGKIFNISYERMVGKDISLAFELLVGEGNVAFSPQLRYYLSENMNAPSGTFISPVIIFGSELAGAGLTIGRQRVFKDKISIDAYLGPAYYTEGMAVWGGINVGIAF
jgi:hypothetical protein